MHNINVAEWLKLLSNIDNKKDTKKEKSSINYVRQRRSVVGWKPPMTVFVKCIPEYSGGIEYPAAVDTVIYHKR